jgi:hypothetical protein
MGITQVSGVSVERALLPAPKGVSSQMTNGPQARVEPAGRPVDCLGLTKRWSLYVASHGNSRVWD